MRALFATTAGAGHFGPMVPLAQACVSAGHQVVVAAPGSFADQVERSGLPHAGFPDAPSDVISRVFGQLPSLPREEADRVVIREVFGRVDAQAALPGLLALVRDWRPDVIVREPAELASLVAAEVARVPLTQVAIGMSSIDGYLAELLLEPLDELAGLAGVEPERARAALCEAPRFTSVPAMLDEATAGPPPTGRAPWGRCGATAPPYRPRTGGSPTRGGTLPTRWCT